ncbi:MAG: hypothetical protein CM15mP125_3510 [Gammaproteobacteria bacterium]|nr:MAG: hypothetical protein CM15mP125_3510 [Gammaproteobacteria bacterium]
MTAAQLQGTRLRAPFYTGGIGPARVPTGGHKPPIPGVIIPDFFPLLRLFPPNPTDQSQAAEIFSGYWARGKRHLGGKFFWKVDILLEMTGFLKKCQNLGNHRIGNPSDENQNRRQHRVMGEPAPA